MTPFRVLNTKKNALQIISLAAYANEINKAIICGLEMNVKKYFYWRSNISYHSNDTPPHYQEKFMSFSKYDSFSLSCPDFAAAALVRIACENIRFSLLFAAVDVLRGGTSATQRQKFHNDEVQSVRNPVRSAEKNEKARLFKESSG